MDFDLIFKHCKFYPLIFFYIKPTPLYIMFDNNLLWQQTNIFGDQKNTKLIGIVVSVSLFICSD